MIIHVLRPIITSMRNKILLLLAASLGIGLATVSPAPAEANMMESNPIYTWPDPEFDGCGAWTCDSHRSGIQCVTPSSNCIKNGLKIESVWHDVYFPGSPRI